MLKATLLANIFWKKALCSQEAKALLPKIKNRYRVSCTCDDWVEPLGSDRCSGLHVILHEPASLSKIISRAIDMCVCIYIYTDAYEKEDGHRAPHCDHILAHFIVVLYRGSMCVGFARKRRAVAQ